MGGSRNTQRPHPDVEKARKAFMKEHTPTEKEVVKKIKGMRQRNNRKHRRDPVVKASVKEQRTARNLAIKKVNEMITLLREDRRGNVDPKKPVMYFDSCLKM